MSTTSTVAPSANDGKKSIIERIGKKIPDPVIIFIWLFGLTLAGSFLMGGHSFEVMGADGGQIVHTVKNMLTTENVRWMFENAILTNWLSFGHGVLGIILIVMLGVGVAEDSGLLSTLIKKAGLKVNDKYLPALLVFIGIMSSVATDAGYLVLIPLAGLLYAGLGKNPLIGMAAAFAGVSAGFSANLLPATPVDVIVGVNAQIFAESQGVPFTNAAGEALTPATMHYFFIFASTFILATVGAWVTHKFVTPKLEKMDYQIPEDLDITNFEVTEAENKGLKAALFGLLVSIAIMTGLAMGPLAEYTNEAGKVVNPFLNNIILMITMTFLIAGVCYGKSTGKFKVMQDVINAMVKQMNTVGYVLVLTFFCYNFLALLSFTGLGTYITFLGASFLQFLGLDNFPILLIIGFIITTAVINLFVGGLTSKWMLLGPIFVPMLYQANPAMTPDLVAAAFRVADSSTNIVTPMMTYAGVILAFMRKYKPDLTIGDMIGIMMPYSIAFITIWTTALIGFFAFNIPLGF